MLTEPFTVDLSDVDPVNNVPRRTIIKTTDAERYNIRIGDYFV